MARKCSGCGQVGHNKRTCPAISGRAENVVVRKEFIRPSDTTCPYELRQRVAIYYPWADKPVVGLIDLIDYIKGNVFIWDEQTNKNHGFNWRTQEKWKIRVEQLAPDTKVRRRRRRRSNPKEK